LRSGSRLLDIGFGWGSMLIHAGRSRDVEAVGVTVSAHQAELAVERVVEAGLSNRVEIRLQDYRDIDDGPCDAISSIGMFEHVGRSQMQPYMEAVASLLVPGGRFLNHSIARPADVATSGLRGRAVATGRRVATALASSRGSRIDSPFLQR
jgi:cyclopropane-fatty-acyl-phospholipid synthase